MKKRFENWVIAVTGATTGIGLETCVTLARDGAVLAMSSSDKTKGDAALRKVQEFSPKSFYWKCNVAEEKEVQSYFKEIEKKYGKLDAAFNNAGIEGTPAPTHEYSTEVFDKVIGINLRGVWLCMREEIKLFLKNPEKKGSIVNTSSVAGMSGISGMSSYVASKHAVNGLTVTASAELAGTSKIRVNTVCPGPIQTPMLSRFMESNPDAEKMLMYSVPMKRIGKPSEVAEAVAYLLSDASSYTTGHHLTVDGGMIG